MELTIEQQWKIRKTILHVETLPIEQIRSIVKTHIEMTALQRIVNVQRLLGTPASKLPDMKLPMKQAFTVDVAKRQADKMPKDNLVEILKGLLTQMDMYANYVKKETSR